MKTTIMAIALLMSGTALAQTTTDTGNMTDTGTMTDTSMETNVSATDMSTDTSHDMSTHSSSTMNDATVDTSAQSNMTMASSSLPGPVIQPSNANPEEDARGIAVISAPAIVPPGWNGVPGTAMGGPLVDPATGEAVGSDETYPACSATVTDNCVQAYAR